MENPSYSFLPTVRRAPRVAAVIVNYRTPDLTIDCALSLRRVYYDSLDLIVVENASGDDSADRLRRDLPEDVTLIVAETNGGYTAGNNLGINAALAHNADYVLILNPDTVVHDPLFLSRLVEHMEVDPAVGAVGPRVHLRKWGTVQNTVLRFPWLWRRIADWHWFRVHGPRKQCGAAPVVAEALNGVCVLFRSRCLADVGLFDELTFAYIEDIDWAYRAEQRHWQRVYLPTDSVIHLQKEGGYERGGSVDFLLKRNTLYFLLKTRHFLQAIGYTVATLALTLAHGVCSGSFGAAWALLRAFAGLWMARGDRVMGRPNRPHH